MNNIETYNVTPPSSTKLENTTAHKVPVERDIAPDCFLGSSVGFGFGLSRIWNSESDDAMMVALLIACLSWKK